MKLIQTIPLAAVICAISLSSCSRVYHSRSYVKSNPVAKEQQKEVERTHHASIQIESTVPQSISLNTSFTGGSAVHVTPYAPQKAEKAPSTFRGNKSTDKTSVVKETTKGKSAEKLVTPTPAPKDTGKDQLVALLLAWFVGYLGIHRFYLGYTGIGLIQLFTLGGLGIWALIDLILIITGDLKPKNGEYSNSLGWFD